MSAADASLKHLIHDIHGHAAKFGDAADQLRDANLQSQASLLALIRRNAQRLVDMVDDYKKEVGLP